MFVAFLIFEAVCLVALLTLVVSERRHRRRLPEIGEPQALPEVETMAPEAEEAQKEAA